MENTKQFVIMRSFKASRDEVWDAWTKPELAKKWWGPVGFTAPSMMIDFRVGGKYLYCMRGKPAPDLPIGDFWSGGKFKEIIPGKKILLTDSFMNEKGEIMKPSDYGMDPEFPIESDVSVLFEDKEDGTKLSIIYHAESDKAIEVMERVKMRDGWESSLDKLAMLLEK